MIFKKIFREQICIPALRHRIGVLADVFGAYDVHALMFPVTIANFALLMFQPVYRHTHTHTHTPHMTQTHTHTHTHTHTFYSEKGSVVRIITHNKHS